MEKSRRSFFKKGLAGAILLGTASVAKAGLPDPVKPKAAKAVNPFHLGMAGYTFVNFDLETTLKTLQRLYQGFPLAVQKYGRRDQGVS